MAPYKKILDLEEQITDADLKKFHNAIDSLPKQISNNETIGTFKRPLVRLSEKELERLNKRYDKLISEMEISFKSDQFLPENVAHDDRFSKVLHEITNIASEIHDTLRAHGIGAKTLNFSVRKFDFLTHAFEIILKDPRIIALDAIEKEIRYLFEKFREIKDYIVEIITSDPSETPEFGSVTEIIHFLSERLSFLRRKISRLQSQRAILVKQICM